MSTETPEPSMPSRFKRGPAASTIRRLVASLCSLPYRATRASSCRTTHCLLFRADYSTIVIQSLGAPDDSNDYSTADRHDEDGSGGERRGGHLVQGRTDPHGVDWRRPFRLPPAPPRRWWAGGF